MTGKKEKEKKKKEVAVQEVMSRGIWFLLEGQFHHEHNMLQKSNANHMVSLLFFS